MNSCNELLEKYSIKNEANEYLASLLKMVEGKYDSFPISTGFVELDQYFDGGVHSGQLITIGARPSIGKTAFAISLIRNMLERDNKILFFSLEMSSKDIISRLVASISGVSLYDISKNDSLPKVISTLDYLFDKTLYIVDIPSISIEALLDITRTAVTEKHLDCIIIDHFRLIDGVDFSSDKYGRASKKLKELAMRLNVPIITMLQFPQDDNQREPALADVPCIMSSLVDDSDAVLFLHRQRSQIGTEQSCTSAKNEDDRLQSVKIIIAMNKNGDTGHTFVGFDGSTTSFGNIEAL